MALWWEALWPRLWPVLGVVGLFLVVALLGLPLLLPRWLHLLGLAGFALALVWVARRAFRGLRPPAPGAADRRLERASGLRHQPLETLDDHAAGDDPLSRAVWAEHQRRARAMIGRLRVGIPRPGLAGLDRRALRGALVVALVASAGVAGEEAPERLRRAFLPQMALPPAPEALRLEAWVTPPAYTRAPPLFLDAGGGAITVPTGSRLHLALSGGSGGVPDLLVDGVAAPFRGLDATSYAAEAVLDHGLTAAIRRDGSELVRWVLTARADAPPVVAFSEPPARAARGLAIRLPWRAEDDWGLASVRADLRLVGRPGAAPMAVDLSLPAGAAKQARGTAQPDLSAHPWAGLDVAVTLVATDGAGQEGQSEPAVLTLPERAFSHPVAQALIAQRRALSLDPSARTAARLELDRITGNPETFEDDVAIFLTLRAARARLTRDRRPEAVPEVQEIFWDVAVALEEGRTDRTARALAEARQALREALETARQREEAATARDQEARPDAERAEAERRIQELREAIRRHLEALAERLQRENGEALPYDPANRLMDQRDLDRRTERMREANREDRPRDAQQELAELERMLDQLEQGQASRGESAERQQRRERGQQQMGVMQDMVRRQQALLDQGHQRAEAADQRRQTARRQPGRQPPAGEEASPGDAAHDARVQRALRRALGEVMQQFGDVTGEVPEPLGRADQAMRDAQARLGAGGDARPDQQRALRELAEGSRQMAQQMQRQFGQSEPGDDQGEGEGEGMADGDQQGGQGQAQSAEQGQGRDPLGRRAREAPGAAENNGDTRVPDEAELLRSRRIQEELRRRGAERARPVQELDYIDRLLKRF
ncbi:uncharacterized protein (TIGR02302 family) [Humitalea rosea]|uniref:Uncharacterized protein (TIGR02302 family) n=2 Tax=Humitalea rosea TaxID=990373 RepID=A0A2W7INR5_9PROT|nr:uncharacterized protein (TIGR02302 family) [Humitalea rosea]